MAKSVPAIRRLPGDCGDGRVTYRLYPETAAMIGECLLFWATHHPDHPWRQDMRDWAKVMKPTQRKRRRK